MRPVLLWGLCAVPGKCLLARPVGREGHGRYSAITIEMASQQQVSRSLLLNATKTRQAVFLWTCGQMFMGTCSDCGPLPVSYLENCSLCKQLATLALKWTRFWLQICDPACLFGTVILLPLSTWSRHLWEQLFARIREKKKLNIPDQGSAAKDPKELGLH